MVLFYIVKIGQNVVAVYSLQLNHVSLVPSPPDLEVISIEVGTKHDFVLCSIYIPPDSPACC